MKHLFALFQNFPRLRFATPQLVGTATFTFVGYSLFTGNHTASIHSVGRIVDTAISLVGYLVVANIFHRHLNEVLKLIIGEIDKTRQETRHTGTLLRELFGGLSTPPKIQQPTNEREEREVTGRAPAADQSTDRREAPECLDTAHLPNVEVSKNGGDDNTTVQ